MSRGESFDVSEGIRYAVGLAVGTSRGGVTRRTPTIPELQAGFAALVERLSRGAEVRGAPGVTVVGAGGEVVAGPPADPAPAVPYAPVLDQDVICLEPAPKVVRRTLFGDVGCPYAEDPAANPHYAGVALPEGAGIARLGCAFCAMGGDYQKRPAPEVVAELVDQARYLADRTPDLEELVLGDQAALRYLGDLVRAARAAGVPPVRWLFAARADAFGRQRRLAEAAIAAAEETGQTVELYLTGFESFSDRELVRYNKGLDAEALVASIAAMRKLAADHPGAFDYARARGHSLILWSPWTSLDDLDESLGRLRRHGLGELFDELGRNRLRLYHDLPITHAARRDGALLDHWDDGDAGAGRRKGYNPEHPWRFLEPGTRLAYGSRDASGIAWATRPRPGSSPPRWPSPGGTPATRRRCPPSPTGSSPASTPSGPASTPSCPRRARQAHPPAAPATTAPWWPSPGPATTAAPPAPTGTAGSTTPRPPPPPGSTPPGPRGAR